MEKMPVELAVLGVEELVEEGRTGRKKEEGQGLVEYALILLFVAIVIVAILIFLGPQVGKIFSQVTRTLT